MSKWITFVQRRMPENRKTKVFDIIAKDDGFILGQISWWSRWRQYAFFPNENTVYEKTCLDDIRVFLIDLMLQRKKLKSDVSEKEEATVGESRDRDTPKLSHSSENTVRDKKGKNNRD